MATKANRVVRKVDDSLSLAWSYDGSRKLGLEVIARCSLGAQAALAVVRQEARRAGLRTNGFRSVDSTPARLLYTSHRVFFERVLTDSLRRAQLEPLTKLVHKAPLAPQYRLLDWRGESFVIEVTCLSVPGAPDPGARFGGSARGNADPALVVPAPTAPTAPEQPRKQRREAGVFAGPGLALEAASGALPGLPDELTAALPAQQARRASLYGDQGGQPARRRPEPVAPETQLKQGSLAGGRSGGQQSAESHEGVEGGQDG